MEVRGFEPRTFRMQSGRSTTELHPQLTFMKAKLQYLNQNNYGGFGDIF